MKDKVRAEIFDAWKPVCGAYGRVVRAAEFKIMGAASIKLGIFLAVALAATAAGCRFATPEAKTRAGKPMHEVMALTPNQLRLRMRALVGPMCGEIEQAADAIVAGTTNRTVQRAALEWKIEAVPEMREALFQPDPLVAYVDSWALCNQMADYFETGPGKTALGDSNLTAVATCRALEESLAQMAATITFSGQDVSRVRAEIRQWAADHPIKHSISGRETTLSRVLERDAVQSLSTGEVVVDMATAVDDLSRRLEVYAEQVVRQARWESELFQMQILSDLPLDQALPLAERAVKAAEQAAGTVSGLGPSVEKAVNLAENTPKLLASEREAVIKALHEELIRTIQFLQEERATALTHLTQERTAALSTVAESIEQERKLSIRDLDRMSVEAVDHAFWRAAQLAAVILVAVFVALVVLLLITRRLFLPVRNGGPELVADHSSQISDRSRDQLHRSDN